MIKGAKFKANSNSVLSYQQHTSAVRRALSTAPQLVPPPAAKEKAPRKRRERAYYQRLAWIARAFPLVIAVASLGVLWDSDHLRRQKLETESVPTARLGNHVPRGLASIPLVDTSLALAQDPSPGPERARRNLHANTPSGAILLEDPARLSRRSDEIATMGTLVH